MDANTVFVVEDEGPVRAVIVEALERSGYQVIGFADGAGALQQMEETLPDLILLDMRMPVMDGF